MRGLISAALVLAPVPGWAGSLEGQDTPGVPPACGAAAAEDLPPVTLSELRTGRLGPGESICLGLMLGAGEFARISIDADVGFLRARVLDAREREPLQTTLIWSFFPSLPLVIEAPAGGIHLLELSVPADAGFEGSLMFTVQMQERRSARAQAAVLEDLRRDPRVAWLREHAVPIRSLDPDDEDFSDLEFLQETLGDARIVLLGEGDHGGGTDVLAKTRLTKFLHRRMGFDVVAFEAGLHSSSAAWRALAEGTDPRTAVLESIFGILGESEQAGPLLRYLAAAARSDRPLELTGFDSQFTGNAAATLLPELQRFLAAHGVASPLTDADAPATQVLAGLLDGRFARERETLPSRGRQTEAVEGLRATAAEIARSLPGREGSFWAQVLRSTAVQMGLMLDDLRGAGQMEYVRGRDRQMAENLLWLADVRYPGRRIVVWTHTAHAMRNPEQTEPGRRQGFTMGHGLWEALGTESFAIALTSYEGTTHWLTQAEGLDQDIVPDQHPSFEFEELMAAAGHEFAFVNLRDARELGAWLGGRFVAQPLYLIPENARWSESLDALLFIRTQAPRRRAANRTGGP